MNFFDLVNISERFLEIVNPSSPEKIIQLGKALGLKEGSRVLDFGSGYAEALVLWAENYGISGVGIEVREHACNRAKQKIVERNLADQIEIVCTNGANYEFAPKAYDAVTCIGASFIWGAYREAIRAMKPALREGGRIGIGEPYWLTSAVPKEYKAQNATFRSESELLEIARAEGFHLEYLIRSSHDDWDRYESGNWQGLLAWLRENPSHPQKNIVFEHFRQIQDEYLRHNREYLGWAIHVLVPMNEH